MCILIRFSVLAARTIEGVVYVLGRTGGEAGDDVADVEAEGGGLDAGTGAPPRLRPGLGPIHRLGIAAQHGRLREHTAGADIVGDDLDGTIERAVAGKPEHKVDVVLRAEIRHFRAAVVTIATQGDSGSRPVPADTACEPAQLGQ